MQLDTSDEMPDRLPANVEAGEQVLLRGSSVYLRPILPSDHPTLYQIASHPETTFHWRFRGAPPPAERFAEGLHRDVLVQFTICAANVDEVLGHAITYLPDLRNGFAHVAVVVAPRHVHTGTGLEAFLLLMEYLFRGWPFRKLYAETMEFDYEQFRSAERSGLYRVEGRLREHTYYVDRYWDQLLLAFYRDDWVNVGEPLLRRLRATSDGRQR